MNLKTLTSSATVWALLYYNCKTYDHKYKPWLVMGDHDHEQLLVPGKALCMLWAVNKKYASK